MANVKSYDELDFTDDFMFGKVMEDKGLCRDVLECLLQTPIGELTDVGVQHTLQSSYDSKPIRLDVYTRDFRAVYDAEMQNLNNTKVENLELPRRSRFYQSAIDSDLLNKGTPYTELPDSNIIFICTFDPLGKGLCKYSFSMRCEEDPAYILKDGVNVLFFNSTYDGEDLTKELKELFDFIQTGKVSGRLSCSLQAAVEKARLNSEWRSQFMKELLIYYDYKQEGRVEGRAEGRVEGREEALKEAEIEIAKVVAETAKVTAERDEAIAKVKELEEKLLQLQA